MATEARAQEPFDWDPAVLLRLEFPIVNYEVSREKIREYVNAIGDRNPIHSDPAAARALGYRDVVAPPTFVAVFATRPVRQALADRAWLRKSKIAPSRILHGEQFFDFLNTIHPHDRLIVQSIVDEVYEKNGLGFISIAIRVDRETGERMAEGNTTLVVRPR